MKIINSISYFLKLWFQTIILQKELCIQYSKMTLQDKGYFELQIPKNTLWTELEPIKANQNDNVKTRVISRNSQKYLQCVFEVQGSVDYLYSLRFTENI
jgi:hypothetical protein